MDWHKYFDVVYITVSINFILFPVDGPYIDKRTRLTHGLFAFPGFGNCRCEKKNETEKYMVHDIDGTVQLCLFS